MIIVAFLPLSDSPSLMDWAVTLGGKSARGVKYPDWVSQARRNYYGNAGIYESVEMVGVKSDLGDIVLKVTIPALLLNSVVPKDARIILANRDLQELSQDQYDHRDFVGAFSVEDMFQFNEKWFGNFWKWAVDREVFIAEYTPGQDAKKSSDIEKFIKKTEIKGGDARNNLR